MTTTDSPDVRDTLVRGEYLRHVRETFDNGPNEKKGLSRQVVATRAGISTSTLQRIEESDTGTTIATIAAVTRELGLPITAAFVETSVEPVVVYVNNTPPGAAADQLDARLATIESTQAEILRLLRGKR